MYKIQIKYEDFRIHFECIKYKSNMMMFVSTYGRGYIYEATNTPITPFGVGEWVGGWVGEWVGGWVREWVREWAVRDPLQTAQKHPPQKRGKGGHLERAEHRRRGHDPGDEVVAVLPDRPPVLETLRHAGGLVEAGIIEQRRPAR